MSEHSMNNATELFEGAMSWLKDNYNNFMFFMERDIVWTVQIHISQLIKEQRLPYQVFNDYPMLPGKRRSLSTDLAILDRTGLVEVAAEFKYEPSHNRKDILPKKFPVVFWGDVGKDVERINDFVSKGKARVAYSVFIDEGSYFRHRVPHPGSEWIDWRSESASPSRIAVLWSHAKANSLSSNIS